MKTTNYILHKKIKDILTLSLCSIISCTNRNKLVLANENFFTIADSISINVDSITFINSKSFQYKDSVFIFPNEADNSITMMKPHLYTTFHLNFDTIKKKNPRFNIESAWLTSPDSIFVYSSNAKYFYLFNHNQELVDSFSTSKNRNQSKELKRPSPHISTSQLPHIFKDGIYVTGFSLGENVGIADSNKFVVSVINKKSTLYYVNYPNEYTGKDWGGIYFRMVYNCVVENRFMCVSFPASSQIAVFDFETKNVDYLPLYPDMKDHIKPFTGTSNKAKIALHYYSQYSFKEIIYDQYRKVYYRFLLHPTSELNIKHGKLGVQKKYLLVYDNNFKYLGCSELDDSISHSTYFVTKKGLFLKNLKNKRDEDNLYFYLFTFNNIKL